jgi:hypothetical protein
VASKRELVLAAIVAKLTDAADKPPALNVHRYRTRPIDSDRLPAAVVYVGPGRGGVGENVTRMDHDPGLEHALSVRIELRVTGEPPDAIVDPLYVWVIKTLRGDPTLSGLCRDIEEQASSFDAEERDRIYGALALDLLVSFATKENDPEAAL